MTPFVAAVPLAVVLATAIVAVFWRRQQEKGNARQFTIYSRIQAQLHAALAREELSWDQFVITMNTLRETHNERLRGPSRPKYLLPYLETRDTMEGQPIHDAELDRSPGARPTRRRVRPTTPQRGSHDA